MFSDAYTLVWKYPGIDTPVLCIALHEDEVRSGGPLQTLGEDLAGWLMKNYPEYWESTCRIVDRLIEDGKVIFMDDGRIFPMGYFGEGSFTRETV